MNKCDLRLKEALEKKSINLNHFVTRCCYGQDIDPQEVIDRLLAVEDEDDVINGLVPADSLRLHIELWIANGKPYYSGKELG